MTHDAFPEICRRVCDEQGWELQPNGILVPLADGRRQIVSIEHFEHEQEQLVRLSAVIGSARDLSSIRLEAALRINAMLPHGAFAIREGDLTLTDTLMLEDTDPAELEASVRYLAAVADRYEEQLFGTDDH